MTHLPIVIDPSHAAGIRWMVEPLALAAIAAGADGLMIEVHNDPEAALCDGPQSMTPEGFDADEEDAGVSGILRKDHGMMTPASVRRKKAYRVSERKRRHTDGRIFTRRCGER